MLGQILIILFVTVLLQLTSSKLVLTPDEWDHVTHDQVLSHADLVSSTPHQGECPEVEANINKEISSYIIFLIIHTVCP